MEGGERGEVVRTGRGGREGRREGGEEGRVEGMEGGNDMGGNVMKNHRITKEIEGFLKFTP